MAKGLFHVSMIVDAGALYAVTTAAAINKARDVQIQPVAETASKKNSAAGDTPRVPARTVLIPWWAKHKTFNMKDAILFAVELGYNKGAVYTATLGAMKAGLLQRTGPGDYKTLSAIKKAAKTLASANGASTHGNAKAQRTTSKPHDTVHTDFVLMQIGKGVVTYKTLGEAFVADGRAKRSIDGALGKLKADKKIANSGPGEYKLLAKGQETLKSMKA